MAYTDTNLHGGDLNKWVVIERPVPLAGAGADAQALQWTRVCGAWASFESKGGLEMAVADQLETRIWWLITIRKLGRALDHTMRVNYNGRILNVTSVVDPTEANERWQLTCWEGKGIL
jgi:SPP1 family predicted phage head-tail adaptor